MILSIDAPSDHLLDEATGKLWRYDGKRHVVASTEEYQKALRWMTLGLAAAACRSSERPVFSYSVSKRCSSIQRSIS